jgi:hypothetical protein
VITYQCTKEKSVFVAVDIGPDFEMLSSETIKEIRGCTLYNSYPPEAAVIHHSTTCWEVQGRRTQWIS